ncbi:MAG: aminoacyl-tRNA hydrolase [Desulfomonilia bacterium]
MSIHFFYGAYMMLVYGLGNPGRRYRKTRHNIGFMVVDSLAEAWNISLKQTEADIITGRGFVGNVSIILAKPCTYMNRSGLPLRRLGSSADQLLVIHDDMDIELGKIRVKAGGGSGGHKGIESIIEQIGSDAFLRIRCGIGRPASCCDPSEYVLGQFSNEEQDLVASEIEKATDAAFLCIRGEFIKAMNAYNRRERDISTT